MADPQYCLLAVDHWSTCLTKAEWAGWVQAVGSVLAIAAGVVGILWQGREQRRAVLRQILRVDLDRISDHLEILEAAASALGATVRLAAEPETYRQLLLSPSPEWSKFGHISSLVNSFDPKDVPRPESKVAVRAARQICGAADRLLSDAYQRAACDRWDQAKALSDVQAFTQLIPQLEEQVKVLSTHAQALRGAFAVVERV